MSKIPTPHITANLGDFAETVLMPGDPLRSQFIAENYLENAELVNNVRGIQGYTGYYKGKRVSVMASGMGIPSIGIYSHELFHFYDVNNIIRIGSAGSINPDISLRDIVIAMSAYTNSSFGVQFSFKGDLAPCCSYELLKKAEKAAANLGQPIKVGAVFSSDTFYGEEEPLKALKKLSVLAVEMETAALYLNAAYSGKNALAILTISDDTNTGIGLTAQERQSSFTKMMEIALELA